MARFQASRVGSGKLRKGLSSRKSMLTFAAALIILSFGVSQALAVHALGLFELDANPIDSPAGGATDWAGLFSSTGTPLTLPAAAIADFWVCDGLKNVGAGGICGKTPDPTTFATGSKDTLPISGWQCNADNNVNGKIDLIHTYGVAFINPSNSHNIVYLGMERFSDEGDANVGFWILQSKIGCDDSAGTATFTGSHLTGDLLVLSAFTNGGIITEISVYEWVGTALNTSPIATGVDCRVASATDAVCGRVNNATLGGFPWATDAKEHGIPANSVATAEFYEMGIDLTALIPSVGCFTGVIADTRSSQSLTATLFDYTLGDLDTCVQTRTVTHASSTGVVNPGTSVTDTALVNSLRPSAGPPPGTVQFYWCGPLASASGCSNSTGTALGSPVSLAGFNASASSALSSAISPNATGFYCFAAYYSPPVTSPPSHFQPSFSVTPTLECFHVVAPTTTTTTASSQGTVLPGTAVHDNVTVVAVPPSAGTPTGSVQFYWCFSATSAPGCSDSGTALGSPVALSSGFASSGSISPGGVGFYCFAAYYTPNTSNFKASNSTTVTHECFQVVAPTTTTTTSSSTGVVAPSTAVHDHVVVAAVPLSAGTPTGSVQFYWCFSATSAPGCSNSGTALGSPVALSSGAVDSSDISPIAVGFYCFAAYYTPNTSNFLASNSTTKTLECFHVVAPTTTTTSSSSQGNVAPGTVVNDTVTVAAVPGGAGTPTGSVQFYFCGPLASASGCNNSGSAVGSPVTLSSGSATSPNRAPTVVGFYCWAAYYTPDTTNFLASNSTIAVHECFRVVAPTTTTTTSSSQGTVLPGTSVNDSVIVAAIGTSDVPTGSVQFYFCGPLASASGCTNAGTAVGSPVALSGGMATSGNRAPLVVGFYCWAAYYTPNTGNFLASNSTTAVHECFHVVAPTTTTTGASKTGTVNPGTAVFDSVTVAAVPPAAGTPTGSVEFFWCGPLGSAAGCNNSGTSLGSVGLTGGKANSSSISPTLVGFYCFAAYYTPNTSNFLASNSTTSTLECFHVVAHTTVTTTSSEMQSVDPGTAINDTAVVDAIDSSSIPTGTVQFYICGPLASATGCDSITGSAVDGPVALVNGSATSGPQSPTHVGFYCWAAYYVPDTSDFLASNSTSAESECFHVVAHTQTTTVASETGVVSPGDSVTDTALVAAIGTSDVPTGSVEFWLCGSLASASGCTSSDLTAQDLGPAALNASGYATSAVVNPIEVGFYCFAAYYTPDTSNFLASNSTVADLECFQVVAPTTTTTSASSQGTVSPGTVVNDTVTVAAVPPGAGIPTGSIQFYICGALSSASGCTSAGTALGSPVALLNGSALSPNVSPNPVGWYCFAAYYTPDTTNFLASNSTTAVHECFHVVAPTNSTTSSSSQGVVNPGTVVNDTVTVAAIPPSAGTPTGSVQFYFCGPLASASGCSNSGTLLGSPINLSSGMAQSTNVSPTAVGWYCFAAYYTPDTSNFLASNSTTAAHECFHVVAPTVTTTSSSQTGSVSAGTSAFDTATVNAPGTSDVPTGSIHFWLCGPLSSATGCTSGTAGALDLGSVVLSGGAAQSGTVSPSAAGFYCFAAYYTPDTSNFLSSNSTTPTNECFQVLVQPTRTIGWWATHLTFMQSTWAGYIAAHPSGASICGVTVTTDSQAMGVFWASISKLSNGQPRAAIDQHEMILAQQWIGALLNVQAFGTSDGGLLSAAQAACATDVQATIDTYAGLLDAFNQSGDLIPTGLSVGSATPQAAKAFANKVFWDAI